MEQHNETPLYSLELPSRPEVEKVRQACTTHGDYYADRLTAALKLNDTMQTVRSEEELTQIVANDPELRALYESSTAIDSLTDRLRHPARGLQPLLVTNKTGQINSFVGDISDELLAALGRPPDVSEVQQATLFFAMQTAIVNHNLGRRASRGKFESLLVNQFANTLLAKADASKLCSRFTRSDDEQLVAETQQQVQAMTELFKAEVGREVNPEFFMNKLLSLRYNLVGAINMVSIKEQMTAPEATEAQIRELGEQNTALMRQIRRIQAYGVKSVIFPFNDVVPGYDAVFHNYHVLGQDAFGEQPMALIQLAPSSLDSATKLDKTIEDKEVANGTTIIRFGAQHPIIVIDNSGELFHGAGPVAGIPLRELFEQGERTAEYEMLRAGLLTRLFDSVAPAIIVDRLNAEGNTKPTNEPTDRVASINDTINRLMLPRIHYLNNKNSKEIKRAFNEALEQEEQDASTPQRSGKKLHKAEGFTRNLPKNAKGPSQDAIANAKAYFGDDYELPPGKTFVKTHDRGDAALGVVAGYFATQR